MLYLCKGASSLVTYNIDAICEPKILCLVYWMIPFYPLFLMVFFFVFLRYYPRDFNFDSVSLRHKRQCKTLERDPRNRNPQGNNPIMIPKCSTEKILRRQMIVHKEEGSRTDTLSRRAQSSTLRKSSDSLGPVMGSVKNVTIHPEVTQFSYNHHKPG